MKKIILLIIPFLLSGCNYSELNTLGIVTGFAIDYENNEYNVSMLVANSKKNESSNKEGEAQTTVYSGRGKNLSEVIKQIDRKSPKNVYIGHLGVVIISEEVAKKGMLDISDMLLRSAESRKKFYLIQANGVKAKDVLSTVIPLESFPAQGILALSKSTKINQAITTTMPFSYFITDILKQGVSPTLPSIEIIGNPKEGQNSSLLEETTIETYLKISNMALYRNDKFIAYAENKESQIINLLNNNTSSLSTTITDEKNNIGFGISNIKAKIKLIDTSNIEINISGNAEIKEINGKYNLQSKKTIEKLEKKLNKVGVSRINSTIDSLQNKYKTDSLGFGNLIYQKYPKEWKKLKKNWEEENFKNIDIKINSNIKIVSTGSLKQTIKEVK